MLKSEDNERLVRVGPGTPMGNAMRRYWLPALLSSELPENDGAPVRTRLLCEDLVAFRDSDGKVGLVDAYCPHRRAPMFFGRNEDHGLRCVYHGWKFARNGACVDMPSEPPDSLFTSKVSIRAYPTFEVAGVVWTYMGPPDKEPAQPDYEWTRVPATHTHVSKTEQHANWLQGVEGGFDAAHATFLHNEFIENKQWVRTKAGAPKLDIDAKPYGMQIAALRELGERGTYVRISQFVMPSIQFRGQVTVLSGERAETPRVDGHVWVPIDDEHTWVYNFIYGIDESVVISEEQFWKWEAFSGRGKDDLIVGSFRLKTNLDNDFMIDRELQRSKTFTGIKGINTQDIAVQEGMGTIVDRSKEHLGTSDRAVIMIRQLLLDAVAQVESGGDPLGLSAVAQRLPRGYDEYVPRGVDWRDYLRDALVPKW